MHYSDSAKTCARTTDNQAMSRHEATEYRPIIARTRAIQAPIAPVAYDCVKLIFVRSAYKRSCSPCLT
jgi:hypothetical protein